jgi:hypothetical protein
MTASGFINSTGQPLPNSGGERGVIYRGGGQARWPAPTGAVGGFGLTIRGWVCIIQNEYCHDVGTK